MKRERATFHLGNHIPKVGLQIQHPRYDLNLTNDVSSEEGLTSIEYLTVASAAKGVASVITYPHEVLRTRFREQRDKQSKYTGIVQAFRLIAKEEGLAGLYGGLGPHLLKVRTTSCNSPLSPG